MCSETTYIKEIMKKAVFLVFSIYSIYVHIKYLDT